MVFTHIRIVIVVSALRVGAANDIVVLVLGLHQLIWVDRMRLQNLQGTANLVTLHKVVNSLRILRLFRLSCVAELCLNWSRGRVTNLVGQWMASLYRAGRTWGFSQRGLIVELTALLDYVLSVGAVLLAYNHWLTIQEVLITLASVRIVRIWKVPRIVWTITHLSHTLRLAELNVLLLLLLLQSRGVFHLVWSLLRFLRRLLIGDQVRGLTLNRLWIGLRHVAWVCPYKGTRLCVPGVMAIRELVKGTFRKV